MIKRGISSLLIALVAATPLATAQAQTADGVDGERRVDERSAEEVADDVIALSEYQRRFYQVALRAWGIATPNFVLNAFFDEHTNHWQDGIHNFAYGAEFTTRIPEKYDLVISLDWANLRTPDGYWLEGGDPLIDTTWTESNLSLITLDASFHWVTDLDRANTLQLYYGVGLGASLVLGELRKWDLDTERCGLVEESQRNGHDLSLLNDCFNEDGSPTIVPSSEIQSVPPVLPSISATLGLRYLIADKVSVSMEGGFRGLYFYGGLEVGYFWEVRPRVE